jgi:hypothetical protein
MHQTMMDNLEKLAALLAAFQECSAPFDAQIQALQIAKADTTASFLFQIETLKSILIPQILAEGHTMKVNGLTATYVHKETWDNASLRAFAAEVPAVLQCLRDSSYITFRVQPQRI